MKKSIPLKNGKLEISILKKGTIILGEITQGFTTKNELLIALRKAGITYGLIEEAILSLVNGYKSQIPIAVSAVEKERAIIEVNIFKEIGSAKFVDQHSLSQVDKIDLSYPVKKGTVLLTVVAPSKIILRYPDAKKEIIEESQSVEAEYFCGKNTAVDNSKISVISQIDGCTHISSYGEVSVYPINTYRNIGTIHGKINAEHAMRVKMDILAGSHIESLSSLLVDGVIRSAHIHAGGNIQCKSGIENIRNSDTAQLYAGQSLYTPFLRNYSVWAGSHLFVSQMIDRSEIVCMDTIVSQTISATNLSVGNKIIAREIIRNSTINLGPQFVEDPGLKKRKNAHLQHLRRYSDIEQYLNRAMFNLERTQHKALKEMNKSGEIMKSKQVQYLNLRRFFVSMEESLSSFKEKLQQLVIMDTQINREKAELDHYQRYQSVFNNPQIIVTGRIAPGTIIKGPMETLKIREPLNSVRISLDEIKKTFSISPL